MREVIFAGFGGQGVLTGGLIIAYMAANQENINAVWMPSYGPAMRGGKANCVVKFGETPEETIGSPIMENAEAIVAMNEPALDYLKFCKPDAVILANEHGVRKDYPFPEGHEVIFIDALGLATKVNNDKGQSIVMTGAVIKKCKLFDLDYAMESMCQFFEEKGKGKYNDGNRLAMQAGYDAV